MSEKTKNFTIKMKEKIRIGNAGGFWGDDLDAFRRQLEGGDLDYITSDFLAEITMSILRKQQLKKPELGYVTDFVNQVVDNAETIKAKKVKVISNAGGINPVGCAKQIIKGLKQKNIDLKIAVIEGDNIVDRLDEFYPEKAKLKNMETGENFSTVKEKVQSANVYLGVPPIVKALEMGADLIIAGRVTDTSVTMAPLVYEFGWELNDWDKLAAGLVAGHIIECGAQSAGGNFTDWQKVPKWDNFGYPIVEVSPDGSFVVTKHDNTGGLISVDTVREQLVYEMGDPLNYISPDVVANFVTINLEQVGENRVKVFGVKGSPSTPFLKVSMAYQDGYKATGSIIISSNKASEKADIFAQMMWNRLGFDFEKKNIEKVGYNACHLNLAKDIEPNEILLRFNVYDYERYKLDEFAKNLAPLILSGPPGVAVTGGRPRIQNVMSYYPALISKELVNSQVKILDMDANITNEFEISSITGFEQDVQQENSSFQQCIEVKNFEPKHLDSKKVTLRELCLARSGDKGDMANIGVVARSEKIYEFLKENLTASWVKYKFSEHCKGAVKRYELDNLLAINFLLEQSLDGGGTKSLMIDAQGKTYASALLNQKICIPEGLLEK